MLHTETDKLFVTSSHNTEGNRNKLFTLQNIYLLLKESRWISRYRLDYARNIQDSILFPAETRISVFLGHYFETGSGAIQEPWPVVSMSKATGRHLETEWMRGVTPTCLVREAWQMHINSHVNCRTFLSDFNRNWNCPEIFCGSFLKRILLTGTGAHTVTRTHRHDHISRPSSFC
jgi:hypothetical protein